jgi:hypothetical protein
LFPANEQGSTTAMALKASFPGELAGASSFLDSGSRGAFSRRKGWIFSFLFRLDSVSFLSWCERFLLLSGSLSRRASCS